MDFTPIIAQLWSTFGWLIPLILLISLLKLPWAKGHIGGGTFKTQLPANVTQGIGFIRYIKSFQQRVFSETEVDALIHALQTSRRAPSLAIHREHVQNLKRRSDPNAERQCPKCGNTLVICTVNSGTKAGQQFWGCSKFPKCRVRQGL